MLTKNIMTKFYYTLILTAVLTLCSACTSSLSCQFCKSDGAAIIGRVENVLVQDIDLPLKARIDSGAGVSSVHAKILEIRTDPASGEEFVTFQISGENNKPRTIRRKIVQWLDIKVKTTHKHERRPVVLLDFCLAGKKIEARVNLTDRSRFLYPLLIGRNILKTGDLLIDPRSKFMQKPTCK